MKQFVFIILSTLIFKCTLAQVKYYTKEAQVSFYSKALFEDIEAHNKSASCVLDMETGKISCSVPIKEFQFKNALMQEHFNENYLESDKYPKSVFTGTIENISSVDLSKDGVYKCKVSGLLVLHGVSKQMAAEVVFTVKNAAPSATAEFIVKPADHNIKIPAIVRNKVAKEVSVIIKTPLLKKVS